MTKATALLNRLDLVIDPQLLRDDPEAIRVSQAARGASVELVDTALAADITRRSAISESESLRATQKTLGKEVAQAKGDDKTALLEQAQQLSLRVKQLAQAATDAEVEFSTAIRGIQNPIIAGVPSGGEENFVTLREFGEKPAFDFEPRDHVELGEMLRAIDLTRGSKVSGSRFYFLRGIGARLEIALMNMALDKAIAEDFEPLITPALVKPEIMAGTGFLGAHSDEIYYLPADDLYLTGTSEVALAGFHSDEILDLSDGPLRYAGWSTCFRREAGSGGKDTRGILRVHQFNKLEMFSYVLPENAEAEHERLVGFQEQMLQACELCYRVIDVAAGDLGSSAARKFDIEAWVPTQGA
ncbi:MAG: serine--tRNA ligase, partial [Microbacteriaceae bacterium]|nr:serine--tRNA ligase [Microbacteriaceae bacterium]